ncbi:C40 family peptidase [Emticicia soli]|uniref:CHAP domain-containing protein n=1 Tax=Emticicia soli TaxID=2027878 RepID=A0ABW5J766_9BACT
MSKFSKLLPYQQQDVIRGIMLDGLTFVQIEDMYGVPPDEILEIVNAKAVKPYNEQFSKEHQNQEAVHKKTIFGWVKKSLVVSAICFFAVVFIQSVLGGFNTQVMSDSILYITHPLSKVLDLGIAIAFIVFAKYTFFPILATFINERVNTVSLKETFLNASPDSKLRFLAMIVLSLCLLVGLVFSAGAQTNRECIIQTAEKEVGTLEIGGNNRGQRIDFYRSICLGRTVKNYSDPWCGYFVGYVYNTCKVKHYAKFAPRARDWFTNPSLIVYKKNFKTGIGKEPKSGDLVGYRFTGGEIGHIEILVEWGKDYIITIGGNTSNSNTVYRDTNSRDGVRKKKRSISSVYAVANHIDL